MGKQWLEEEDKDVLYFTPFYEEVRLAEIFCDEDGSWSYSSTLLNAQDEYLGSEGCLGSNGKDFVRQYVEDLIETHFEGEVNYHQSLLDCFKS